MGEEDRLPTIRNDSLPSVFPAAIKHGLFINIVDAAVELTKVKSELEGKSELAGLPEPKYASLSRLEVRRVGAGLLCVLAQWADARKRIIANGGESILNGIIQDQFPDRRLREHAQDCILACIRCKRSLAARARARA